jgi:hypothetical protein
MNGYGTFLIVEIGRIKIPALFPPELEYDLVWETAEGLHKEFLGSKHDDEHKGLYECIINFLEEIKP